LADAESFRSLLVGLDPRIEGRRAGIACDFARCLQMVFGLPHQKERRFTGPAMADTADTADVIVRPPIAWALAVLAGLALNWLMPLPFLPSVVSAGWLGAIIFALALALVAWAIFTMTRAGSNVPTNLPTTTIVETGPYRFTRNPIYLGMVLGLIGLTIAFNGAWLLMTLVPFALVIHYGVIIREEAYLERKFGDVYRRYRARVRRWV
jgi:protein-S-isoprenylcysteine O-methyltransferase Ste14